MGALGLRQLALRVRDLRAMEAFYFGHLGFAVAFREEDTVHLTCGSDRLLLRAEAAIAPRGALLHLGVTFEKPSEVDAAYHRLETAGVRALAEPAQRPDGSYAAEVTDPEGNVVVLVTV